MLQIVHHKILSAFAAILLLSLTLNVTYAENPINGEKSIYFIDKQGVPHFAGHITFTDKGNKSGYELSLDDEAFQVYFLSMKEMKCLEGPELWCNLPYPWETPRVVTVDDLSWLSHDLLFTFKLKTEFATNFWNGVYYNMKVEGGIIKGKAQSVDLNLLALKPEKQGVPPLGEAERDDLFSSKRWLPGIEIR